MWNYTPVGGGIYAGRAAIHAMIKHEFSIDTQREIASNIGRAVTGTALIMAGYKLAAAGRLTGTSTTDQGEKGVRDTAHIPPMSIKLGDTWYSINRLGPEIGMLPLVGANLFEIYGHVNKGEKAPDTSAGQQLKMAGAAVLETGKVISEQPFLKSARDVTNAVFDPKRYGGRMVASFASRPIPTVLADVGSEMDPYRRLSTGGGFGENLGNAIKSRIPGLRETLPVRRDIFGQPTEERTGSLYNFTFPQKESNDPVVKELVRVKASIAEPHRRSDEDATLFDYRAQLTGKYMEQMIGRLLDSGRYDNAETDEARRLMIEQVAATAHARAAAQVRSKHFMALPMDEKIDKFKDLLDR